MTAPLVRRLLIVVALAGIATTGSCAAEDTSRAVTPVSSSSAGVDSVAPGGEGVEGAVTADGAPVEGATVAPRSLDTPGRAIREMAVLTDRDGRYFWPLATGNYEITVTADGYRAAAKRVEVVAGKNATLDFALERAP